jgi:hypothetical protein
MPQWFVDWSSLIAACTLLLLGLPTIIAAYYWLRLSVRRQMLQSKLVELNLEAEYLRLYDVERWRELRNAPSSEAVQEVFEDALKRRFRGDNRD